MNLPNKLTIMRVILIPFFVFFLLFKPGDFTFRLIADIIFVIASLTDMLDGKIARKYNLVTNFGKFMDPLADKLLVCSGLICLLDLGQIPAVVVIIIIAREFIISGFRLVAANSNIVIAANMWGKSKTVSQMALIIFAILNLQFKYVDIITMILIVVATALTIISLVTYIAQNKQVLKEQN
ncbi:MAG: CDP-diacylglycerol--glycerol-3-phosphate 3-phosphatidyltransferase [Lachnospiraceae bacterium]|nr:CDP-diacylglycerol--glycerol-3-phosphate 3-phosphatidyltransferase [Lachnospiraceae bacterium]